jgi:mannose-6-phosphate isomerase
MLPLVNPIQNYAWGSKTALAELMGRTATGRPEAELWIGAHPKAPSRLEDGQSLVDAISGDTLSALGAAVASEFNGELPFLLKVLAVAAPLSLQAHPNLEQARAGFDREERAGIGIATAERNYKDKNHKPELLCALTPFEALSGFRAPGEALELLSLLGVEQSALAQALRSAEPLREAFAYLMALAGAEKERVLAEVLERCARAAHADGRFAPSFRWAAALGEHYPGDVGAVCSLLLNYLKLEPLQAVFLEAGRLHAYLQGVGVELMANSDNVLRGGLTPKHVDAVELTHVLRFDGQPITPTPTQTAASGELEYLTPAREFALSTSEVGAAAPLALSTEGPELLLCTEGKVTLHGGLPARVLNLARGAACFLPASLGAYRATGTGRIFRARVGRL